MKGIPQGRYMKEFREEVVTVGNSVDTKERSGWGTFRVTHLKASCQVKKPTL